MPPSRLPPHAPCATRSFYGDCARYYVRTRPLATCERPRGASERLRAQRIRAGLDDAKLNTGRPAWSVLIQAEVPPPRRAPLRPAA
ncbi:MAG: hypothetical protein LC672_01565 [Acidobacteria bacterium]|nr:hypothetical protein [Acidobacteriota bacterium]